MKKIYYPLACCLIGGMLAYGRKYAYYRYIILFQIIKGS